MTYQPYLIANYSTGLDTRLQPWLIPDDAQEVLYDGYVYRGTMTVREGYKYYAYGLSGGTSYRESRIVSGLNGTQTSPMVGVIDSANKNFTLTGRAPIAKGTVVVTGTTPLQVLNDDGAGNFTGAGTGTVDYVTGAIAITFTSAPTGGTVEVTYENAQNMVGLINSINQTFTYAGPVQLARGSVTITGSTPSQTFTDNGIGYFVMPALDISNITNANPAEVTTTVNHGYTTGDQVFITAVGGMTSINSALPYTITVTGLNTFTVNGFDSSLLPSYTSGGTVQKLIGTVNYLTGAISITLPTAPTAGTVIVIYDAMPDDPVMMIATYVTNANVKRTIVASTKYINFYDTVTNTLVDITTTPYTGTKFDFFTWTNYTSPSNQPRLIFSNNKDVIQQYDGSVVSDYVYQMDGVTTLTCSFMVEFKDRLILLRTTEDGVIYPQRIRVSGTGANSDDFRITATGAGFIDIPDGSWIKGADFNRDDLLIFTENSTWVMKYTGNDTTPFVIDRIDESRGSDATFGVITYLNKTSAVSRRGLIVSDGYKVERQDDNIPDFSFNEISGTNFDLCFAGSIDNDKDHYLIYPPASQDISTRILVTNYDEDNYSIYRLPLSCMGTAISSRDIDWNDLSVFNDWDSFAQQYNNWNSFGFNSGAPFTLGGGHHGEIWKLGDIEGEDNPVRIRNIELVPGSDEFLKITTDWNNYSKNGGDPTMGSDYIFFTGIQGMVELNNRQFPIEEIIDNNTFTINAKTAIIPRKLTTDFGTYVPNSGIATRVIPFQATFKKFNPYVNQDKKVRCGWLYMYVNTNGTQIKRNLAISNITNSNPCVITTQSVHNLQTLDQVYLSGIGGMTELNDTTPTITVLTSTTFSLNGIDSTSFGAYTSGGYVGGPELSKLDIEVITNDTGTPTQLDEINKIPYEGNMTNMILEKGSKKWYKVFINQTGRFIQFRFTNQQAGATVNIQATMPGFQPVGRLI